MDYIRNAPVGRSAKFIEDGGVVLANGMLTANRDFFFPLKFTSVFLRSKRESSQQIDSAPSMHSM
jgi:hypothetical protein